MMNMHKLGTVSPAARLFNNSTNSSEIKYLRLIRYTLYVIKGKARRHNSRNGFGFNMPEITRFLPFPTQSDTQFDTPYVNLSLPKPDLSH